MLALVDDKRIYNGARYTGRLGPYEFNILANGKWATLQLDGNHRVAKPHMWELQRHMRRQLQSN